MKPYFSQTKKRQRFNVSYKISKMSIIQPLTNSAKASSFHKLRPCFITPIDFISGSSLHEESVTTGFWTNWKNCSQTISIAMPSFQKDLPTVQYLAEALHVSPGYLSSLLKVLTGQSAQQHIHNKLIEKAKEKLTTTALSVSEIAYELGFEHSQSFSKLFKSKTNVSPSEFRQSFN